MPLASWISLHPTAGVGSAVVAPRRRRSRGRRRRPLRQSARTSQIQASHSVRASRHDHAHINAQGQSTGQSACPHERLCVHMRAREGLSWGARAANACVCALQTGTASPASRRAATTWRCSATTVRSARPSDSGAQVTVAAAAMYVEFAELLHCFGAAPGTRLAPK